MVSVAFFIDNRNIKTVDCRNISVSNPGIGGTEYMIVLIAYMLTLRNNDISVKLYATTNGILPLCLDVEIVDDIKDAYINADSKRIQYFVYRHNPNLFDNLFSSLGEQANTKLIPWCHNFCDYKYLSAYAQSSLVARIICVGKEQMDLYRDHKAFAKSDYIYNCVNTEMLSAYAGQIFNERKHIVTYIGSLVPEKGFALLAKAWPKIIREVPDAELYVVGSGHLYNRNAALGRWGIAEKKFENRFMKYLQYDNEIMKSVHFVGIMGEEKNNLFLNTKVGVPNPSGKTETFGITAVEMQLMGAQIATIKCPGYLDTVVNGILYNHSRHLAQSVISLLKSPADRGKYEKACSYIKERFSIDTVVADWENLLCNKLSTSTKLHDDVLNNNYRHKFLKEKLRVLKMKHTILFRFVPCIESIMSFRLRKFIKGMIKRN